MIGHHLGDIEAAVLDVITYRQETDRIRKELTSGKPLCDNPKEVQH
jgi:hypothetical protein